MSCEFELLREADVKKRSNNRLRIIIPGLSIGIVGLLGYLGLFGQIKEPLLEIARNSFGTTVSDLLLFALILLGIPVFLVPTLTAERIARNHNLICPNCNADLNLLVRRLLKTRCCAKCDCRIVEGGRARRSAAFKRWSKLRDRHMLFNLFWIWPIFGTMCLLSIWTMPSTFQNCRQMPMLIGIIGTSSAGWTLIRTKDKRYLLQFLASTVLLAIGVKLFWEIR